MSKERFDDHLQKVCEDSRSVIIIVLKQNENVICEQRIPSDEVNDTRCLYVYICMYGRRRTSVMSHSSLGLASNPGPLGQWHKS